MSGVVVVTEAGMACPPEVASLATSLNDQVSEPANSGPLPHLIVVALPADATPDACAAALADDIGTAALDVVIAAATDRLTETMAHLAARLDVPLAVNCTAVSPGEPWVVTRTRGGGVLLEDAQLHAPIKLITVSPTAPAAPPRGDVPTELPIPRELAVNGESRVRIVGRAETSTGVSLAAAPVVVSGGRGIGSAEGFAVLEELAAALGGAVGCSRVVTNNGWRPHSDQVGQTGTKVAPKVYIAAGISGATQHWAGCMGSETIIAINTDPEAPMVTRADYAVIGTPARCSARSSVN
jgi:electron transfer flavoprotein alpha subunit